MLSSAANFVYKSIPLWRPLTLARLVQKLSSYSILDLIYKPTQHPSLRDFQERHKVSIYTGYLKEGPCYQLSAFRTSAACKKKIFIDQGHLAIDEQAMIGAAIHELGHIDDNDDPIHTSEHLLLNSSAAYFLFAAPLTALCVQLVSDRIFDYFFTEQTEFRADDFLAENGSIEEIKGYIRFLASQEMVENHFADRLPRWVTKIYKITHCDFFPSPASRIDRIYKNLQIRDPRVEPLAEIRRDPRIRQLYTWRLHQRMRFAKEPVHNNLEKDSEYEKAFSELELPPYRSSAL